MNERKVSIEELSKRIDQLLNVLTMISRDLKEISKSLKEAGAPSTVPSGVPVAATSAVPSAAPAGRMRTIEDAQMLFPADLEEMLTFEESKDYIVIEPRGYLGSDNFAKIASIVRGAGGEYVSAGRQSHFKIPREIE